MSGMRFDDADTSACIRQSACMCRQCRLGGLDAARAGFCTALRACMCRQCQKRTLHATREWPHASPPPPWNEELNGASALPA